MIKQKCSFGDGQVADNGGNRHCFKRKLDKRTNVIF